MDSVPIVQVEHVSKRFTIRKDKSLKERVVNAARGRVHAEHFEALHDISLTIDSGNTVGLIGPNGSGKSTLLKTIGGIIQPSSGRVVRRGRMAALLELGAGFHPDLTGRENVYLNASILGLTEKQTDQYFDAIVDFSGIEEFIDTQVKFYSSGMYVRLAFAVAVHVDPDLLLVDEVLAVGDEAFQTKCLDKIRSFQLEGRTIVLVTHTLSQITDLCTRGIVLSKGNVAFDGAPIDAVGMLRSGFQTQRDIDAAHRLEGENALTAPPRARVDITGVELVDARGERASSVRPGDDLRLRIGVDAIDPIRDWRIGFAIANTFGQVALFSSSERLGIDPMLELRGPSTLEVAMDSLALGPGAYTISAALELRDGGELARAQEAVAFRVEETGISTGLAATPLAATLQAGR